MCIKRASTIEEQIKTLRKRGMHIASEEEAKAVLLDIGYFRLGFYCFPFEISYPNKRERNHQYRKGSSFQDVVDLYHFDNELRHILLITLHHIEVNFRTKMVYVISNRYIDFPTWFVNSNIIKSDFSQNFEEQIYKALRNNEDVIKQHHRNPKHLNDRYAPAWKTLEFMTFGAVRKLFSAIKDPAVKSEIAQYYNINNIKVFENYMNTIVTIRNLCSHGKVLYDISLWNSIIKGPAGKLSKSDRHSLFGALQVILFMVGQFSEQHKLGLVEKLLTLFQLYQSNPIVKERFSGIPKNLLRIFQL